MPRLYVYTKTPGKDVLANKFPENNPNVVASVSTDYNTLAALRNQEIIVEHTTPKAFEAPTMHTIYTVEVNDAELQRLQGVMSKAPFQMPIANNVRVGDYQIFQNAKGVSKDAILGEDSIIGSDYFRGPSVMFSEPNRQAITAHEYGVLAMQERDIPLYQAREAQERTSAYASSRVNLQDPNVQSSVYACYASSGFCAGQVPEQLHFLQDCVRYIAQYGDLGSVAKVHDFQDDYLKRFTELVESTWSTSTYHYAAQALRETAREYIQKVAPNIEAQEIFKQLSLYAQHKIMDFQKYDMETHLANLQTIDTHMMAYGGFGSQERNQEFLADTLRNARKDMMENMKVVNERDVLSAVVNTAKAWGTQARDAMDHKLSFACNNIADSAKEALDALTNGDRQDIGDDEVSIDD